MFEPIHLKTATLPLRKAISRSPLRRRFLVGALALALAGFAVSRTVQAQDGDYGHNNTAEGGFA
jgi:hypothetical protein